jgi:hypothetical protein
MLHGLIDQLSTAFANAVCAGLVTLNANACRFITLRADQHHIRDVDRSLELDTTGIDLAAALRLHLALVLDVDVHTLYHYAIGVRQHIDDLAALAFVFEAAADNFDGIAFADLYSHCFTPVPALQHFRGQRYDLHELLIA